MAKKKSDSSEVIVGEEKSLEDQIKDAKGTEDNKIDAGKKGPKAAEPPYTDAMKARDAQIKEREAYLKDNGIDPDKDRNFGGSSAVKTVEKAKVKEKQYQGLVTCTSVHGQTHEKIAARIDLPVATGEHGVWLAFLAHHPNAMPGEFTIDPTNTDDPTLRSSLE